MLTDEQQALQLAFTSLEEKFRKLQDDNNDLVTRYGLFILKHPNGLGYMSDSTSPNSHCSHSSCTSPSSSCPTHSHIYHNSCNSLAPVPPSAPVPLARISVLYRLLPLGWCPILYLDAYSGCCTPCTASSKFLHSS